VTQPWFRFYRAVVNSPKVQRLPATIFKAWVNLLCCTDDDGALPSVPDLAFTLRTSEREVDKVISSLIGAGLLAEEDGIVTAHDWAEHQRKSDTSNERVKRYRKRNCNVTRNAPDTETDTEAEEDKKEPVSNSEIHPATSSGAPTARREANGTRLPADWSPDDGLVAFAAAQGFHPDRIAAVAEQFRDYWHAVAGAKGRKSDWPATWRNWVRREAERAQNGGNQHHNRQSPGRSRRDIQLAAALEASGGGRGEPALRDGD